MSSPAPAHFVAAAAGAKGAVAAGLHAGPRAPAQGAAAVSNAPRWKGQQAAMQRSSRGPRGARRKRGAGAAAASDEQDADAAVDAAEAAGAAAARSAGSSGAGGGGGGSRGSLNHLLNFHSYADEHPEHFLPRAGSARGSRGASASAAPGGARRRRGRAPQFRKERFVQSAYRLLVSSAAEVALCAADADHEVDWAAVEAVFLPTETPLCCPICLEPPVAPKVTSCGHVFCSPCILHYLALGSHSWRRCPLCFESVYARALKSFAFQFHRRFAAGDEIDFVLMRRARGATYAEPVDASAAQRVASDGLLEPCFRRVELLADVEPVLRRERAQLHRALLEVGEGGAARDAVAEQYVRLALAEVECRAAAWAAARGGAAPLAAPTAQRAALSTAPSLSPSPPPPLPLARAASDPSPPPRAHIRKALARAGRADEVELYEDALDAEEEDEADGGFEYDYEEEEQEQEEEEEQEEQEEEGEQEQEQEQKEEAAGRGAAGEGGGARARGEAEADAYYFYQSRDGQLLFLHPLNYRSLQHEFGAAARFPQRLRARLLETETLVQDADTRGKFRFLSHLPLKAALALAYVDLTPVLSDATKAAFAGEFERRRKAAEARLRKQRREEERARQRARAFDALGRRRAGFDEWGNALPSVEETLRGENFPILPAADSPPLQRAATEPSKSGWSSIVRHGFASSELWTPLAAADAGSVASGSAPSPSGSPELRPVAARAPQATPPRPAAPSWPRGGGRAAGSPLQASAWAQASVPAPEAAPVPAAPAAPAPRELELPETSQGKRKHRAKPRTLLSIAPQRNMR